MKNETCTDQVVSQLVANLLPSAASLRDKHLLRETLNSLVRLAKSEQILEMKNNIRHLTGLLAAGSTRARFRSPFMRSALGNQQQFEFMKPE